LAQPRQAPRGQSLLTVPEKYRKEQKADIIPDILFMTVQARRELVIVRDNPIAFSPSFHVFSQINIGVAQILAVSGARVILLWVHSDGFDKEWMFPRQLWPFLSRSRRRQWPACFEPWASVEFHQKAPSGPVVGISLGDTLD
jgi:hypothetical protein